MKKWQVPLLVLLTALLLTVLGFLPALAGVLQDVGVEKQISHRPLHSIAPYLSEKDPGLHFTDKLTILHDSEISPIVPALASMSEQQVRAAAEERLQPFLDAGILRIHGTPEFYASPYAAISVQDGQRYFLFWSVTLVGIDSDIKYTLSLRIDDETGGILDMNYYDPGLFLEGTAWNGQHPWQDRFARIWLEQAGLWEQAGILPPDSNTQQVQGEYPDFCTAVYEIPAGDGEAVRIHFYAASHGELMMWFELMRT